MTPHQDGLPTFYVNREDVRGAAIDAKKEGSSVFAVSLTKDGHFDTPIAFDLSLAALPLPVQGEAVPDLDEVLRLADEHAEESQENGNRVFDRGGLHQFAKDLLRKDRLAAHPNAQPASPERKPLTDEQISKGCNYAIELSNEIERAAFRKGVKFAEDAHRIAATQEPRT